MKVQALLFALVFGALTAAASAAPPAGVMSTLNGLIAVLNADNAAGAQAYFTDDATVIDEFSPYMWTGSNAGTRWWSSQQRANVKAHITGMRAATGTINHYTVTGDSAYVVVPLNITFMAKGKPQQIHGLWALTLRRAGGAWKIRSASWADASPS